MSNATDIKQARKEFLKDVERLFPDKAQQTVAVMETIQVFAQKVQKSQQREDAARVDFIKKNEAAFKTHLAQFTAEEE